MSSSLPSHAHRAHSRFPKSAWALLGAALLWSCSGDDGSDGADGADAPSDPTSTVVELGEDPPGIVLEILALRGGSGAGGNFQVGDRVTVDFSLEKTSGESWDVTEMNYGRIMISGPTFNYQRVIPEKSDVPTIAVDNGDGTYSYTFADAIPAVYAAPYNDTASFDADDGELTGQALLGGTYTVGMYVGWNFTVEGDSHRDAANAVADFVIGAGAVEPRAVVANENCNQCHSSLRAHGDLRRDVTLCLLCHTAGSEDKNVASAAGGTPGASIDFRVMIHKIHNGSHLPSVLGVGTNPDGSRNYAAAATAYELVGYGNSVHDYSEFAFPVMPSAYVAFTRDSTGVNYTGAFGNGPMPRDTGYSALTLPQRELEDRMRAGAVSCASCHGDPDGAGPLEAPDQGDQYKSQPSRASCGSCHDDVDWALPYTANGQTMPADTTNASCVLCHEASGDLLAVEDAHVHPYLDATLSNGIRIDVTDVSSGSGGGGNHAAGDAIEVDFSVTDESGTDVAVNSLSRFQMFVSGPSSNPQWLMPNVNPFDFTWRKSSPFTGNGTSSVPTIGGAAVQQTVAVVFTSATTFDVVGSVSATLAGQAIGGTSGNTAAVSYGGISFTLTQGSTAFANGDRFYFEVIPVASSYTAFVPRDVSFEFLGDATGAGQTLSFGNTPSYWGRQNVMERTALVGAASSLTGSSPALGRYLELDSATMTLAVGDRLVLDADTASEEYVQIGRIQTSDDVTGVDLGSADRVWTSTGLRFAHSAGAAVQECTLTSKREGLAYTMATSGATGIDLVAGQFTAGNPVVASYRTHGRFGYFDSAAGSLRAIYGPFATADTDDIVVDAGDWKGQSLVDGTYRVAMWGNRDITVTPMRLLTTTESFSTINTDNTTYRRMAEPATADFLFGAATAIEPRAVIPSGDACNRCHGDVAAHGFGRRGFDTCLTCHATPGAEDGAKYSFASWYVGGTPGITVDFRSMLHKIHMGKELTNASSYVVNGVFLGTAYPVTYDEVGFPVQPGGVADCASCHGSSGSWLAPADRDHPSVLVPKTLEWRGACGSCHDSDAATAHIEVQTAGSGLESCAVCHGDGKDWSVEKMHKSY